MHAKERREAILSRLEQACDPVSATALAGALSVSRQVIVGDIALLRANGHRIAATRRGYQLESASPKGRLETIVCRHSSDQVLDEFYAVVDNGGSITSVMVEHPIYGEISAQINVASRYDAQEFVRLQKSVNATQLSDLTGGLHIHMISVPDPEAYQRIIEELRRLDILAEDCRGE